MVGVEIDLVSKDSLKALELYEEIFDIVRVEVTNFPQGENEVVFTLYGVRFHMLDENPKYELMAPNINDPKTIWFNIVVPDINEAYSKAIRLGCVEVQPVTDIPDYGVTNATFNDPYGYQWMLHEVHKEVSFEDRNKLWEEERER